MKSFLQPVQHCDQLARLTWSLADPLAVPFATPFAVPETMFGKSEAQRRRSQYERRGRKQRPNTRTEEYCSRKLRPRLLPGVKRRTARRLPCARPTLLRDQRAQLPSSATMQSVVSFGGCCIQQIPSQLQTWGALSPRPRSLVRSATQVTRPSCQLSSPAHRPAFGSHARLDSDAPRQLRLA